MLLLKSIFAILFTQKIGQAEYISHAHQKLSQKSDFQSAWAEVRHTEKTQEKSHANYSSFIKTAKKILLCTAFPH